MLISQDEYNTIINRSNDNCLTVKVKVKKRTR